MKLSLKISLMFGGMLLVALLVISGVYDIANRSSVENSIHQGMQTSSVLAQKQLTEELGLYCKIIDITGTDPVLVSDVSDSELGGRISKLAAQYGFTSGNILDSKGISYKDGTDFSDREYVQKALKGEINISEITLSKLTGKYGFSVAGPLYNESGRIKGVVYYRMDVDFMHEILNRIKASENGYSYLVDGNGLVIVHPNEELIGSFNLSDGGGELADIFTALQNGEQGVKSYTYKGVAIDSFYVPVEGTNGWGLVVAVPRDDYLSEISEANKKIYLFEIIVMIVVAVLSIGVAAGIANAANRVVIVMNKLIKGDFSDDLKPINKKDEIAILMNATCELRDTFVGLVNDENRVLDAITNYNLRVDDIEGYSGEFNELANSVNKIKAMLYDLINQIQTASLEVNAGSKEIARATEEMSHGAVAQANSIDQVMTSIRDINSRLNKSAQNEIVVEDKLKNLDNLISTGNSEMTELFDVVKEIENMSKDIRNIIKLIDSIAFQTNILALNATVEAARAGDSGRGFAVVADEIGNLAERTSAASKQTEEMIEQCIKGITRATEAATSTSNCLNQIVNNSKEINAAFEEISEDIKQQANMSEIIEEEIIKVSDVVATNSAAAVQTATATGQLSAQSDSMNNMIKRFKL